ncbi:unnamed protein product [Mycena citricolor]|uniref:Uncharacterized protein n=1 Tax=Mycena citricolor TaxID=2018698 RepID=A0AAD2H1F0_9AGAR|nr:unnamed protein product [Mycena citricolor]CAK5273698.1 unnamed protein product [Mycena citricolor]
MTPETTLVNPDHAIRLVHRHSKPFLLLELPTELILDILTHAASISKEVYRTLLLMNRRIYYFVRGEKLLTLVPIVLSTGLNFESFSEYLSLRLGESALVRHLFIFPRTASNRTHNAHCVSIVSQCTELRSLGCGTTLLYQSVLGLGHLRHVHCVDLTLVRFQETWDRLMSYSPRAIQFMHQLRDLHLIGNLDHVIWTQRGMVPKLDNLVHLSLALGGYNHLPQRMFEDVVRSPKLEQIVITTKVHGAKEQALKDAAYDLDSRFSVLHRRRRWKERELWMRAVRNPDAFWEQAAREKYLPPSEHDLPARRT